MQVDRFRLFTINLKDNTYYNNEHEVLLNDNKMKNLSRFLFLVPVIPNYLQLYEYMIRKYNS